MSKFRYASRTQAKPLIGLYARSGCGKTYSSLLLARGFTGPDGRIAMIETEGGRGEAFEGKIPGNENYQVMSLTAPFSPQKYGDAIRAAAEEKFDALIIDSASHEWEGDGGVLAMAAANQANGLTGQIVWQKPKIAHSQHFMLPLMQTPIPLVIVCMRARYPMEQRKIDGKLKWARSDNLQPKQSEDILFEMFAHGWIDEEHRFRGTKYTIDDLREIIRDKEPISVETGERLAAWAHGVKKYGITEVAPAETRTDPDLVDKARKIAGTGAETFRGWFAGLNEAERVVVRPHIEELKAIAEEADMVKSDGA